MPIDEDEDNDDERCTIVWARRQNEREQLFNWFNKQAPQQQKQQP